MFAITCNLDTETAKLRHPKGLDGALSEVCRTLRQFGFELQQNQIYLCQSDDLANLFDSMTALKKLSWLAASIRDIRAFRIEQWSDFTGFFKQ